MAGVWSSIASALFKPKDEAEKLKKENARIDKEIATKTLEIKKLKTNLKTYRKEKFHKKLEKLPAQVRMINIDGLSKTSDKLVMLKVQKLFDVESFQEIIQTSKEVHQTLKTLGCFKKVNMSVDTMPEDATYYKINITVEEAGSLFGNLGVMCGAQDHVAGVVKVGVNNIVGGGERGEVELSRGRRGYCLTNFNLNMPLHFLPSGSALSAFVKKEHLLMEHFHSSVAETAIGSALSLSFSKAVNLDTQLKAGWLNTKYNFQSLDQPGVAKWDPLAQYSGHILRSSLATKLSLDLRDDNLLPAYGLLLIAGHQVSFNHSGQHSHEMTINSSLHYPIVRGLSISSRSLYSVVLGTFSPLPQELPHYRTGLQARGVAIPHKFEGDKTTFLSILALTSNLPLLTSNSLLGRHVKLQTFISGHSSKYDSKENITLANLSTTFGIGFVGKILDLGRFELNFCVPLDIFGGQWGNKPGLRFSFGTEFL